MINESIENRIIELMNDDELLSLPAGSPLLFDVECYENLFYIQFKSVNNRKYLEFEMSEWSQINYDKLSWLLWRFCIVGFNSINYDLLVSTLSLKEKTCSELKAASNDIILNGMRRYDFEKEYLVKIPNYNHIDLIEVAPLKGSLKLYGARLHCKTIQDLPFPEHTILTFEQAQVVKKYCGNDNDVLELLFKELSRQLKLRIKMSKNYGVDLRSKSDAQIAEAVLNSEIERITGCRPKRPVFQSNKPLKYNIPDFVKFETKKLQNVLSVIKKAEFEIDKAGRPSEPTEIKKLTVIVGNSTYNIGMGGLHSKEKVQSYKTTDDIMICDNDVASYYPNIILNQQLFPPHIGPDFLKVYKKIVDTRIDAKRKAKEFKKSGDKEQEKHYKSIADSLKITINGSFGKLGSKWSTLYAPQLMLQVTITGQLCLLMLIEKLEQNGIPVVSGNTDGIVSVYRRSEHKKARKIIEDWEKQTNFETEETRYSAIYNRDVNNYIAIKEDNEEKAKGCYSGFKPNLSKNPAVPICLKAVTEYLKNGTSVERTIRTCDDIKKFVSVKNATGGAHKKGVILGKVVRWYYAKNCAGTINYSKSQNMVSLTEGARPLMTLLGTLPDDIDYEWYIENAISMLKDCGGIKVEKQLKLF